MSQAESNAAKAALLAVVLPIYNGEPRKIPNATQQAAFAVACIEKGGPTYGANHVRLNVVDFPGMTNERFNEIAAGNAQWNMDTAWFDGQTPPPDALPPAQFNALLTAAGVASAPHGKHHQ